MAPALWLKIWKFFFEISIRSVRKIFFLKYYLSGRKNRSIVKIVKVCRFVVVVSKLSWNQWIGIPILTARNNRWETDRKSGGLFFFLSVSLYLSPPRTDPYESINGALFRIIRSLLPITLLSLTSLSPSCVLLASTFLAVALSICHFIHTSFSSIFLLFLLCPRIILFTLFRTRIDKNRSIFFIIVRLNAQESVKSVCRIMWRKNKMEQAWAINRLINREIYIDRKKKILKHKIHD